MRRRTERARVCREARTTVPRPPLAWGLIGLALLTAVGCTTAAPEWAEGVNPCCGQDLIEKGIEPPQNRCADMVVDQKTAFQLMKDLSGGAVAHWEVRLIPGGPACIWRIWPGDTSWKPQNVQPDWLGYEDAAQDTAGASGAAGEATEGAEGER